MNLNKFIYGLGLALLGGLVLTGCRKDDPEEPGDAIATFQYEISADNWAEVTFTNYSQNATLLRMGFWRWQHQHRRKPRAHVRRLAVLMM